MGGLLGGGKTVTPPPVPEPPPVPTVQEEKVEETAIKEQRKRMGFERTFLTGSLTPKSTKKKKFLG